MSKGPKVSFLLFRGSLKRFLKTKLDSGKACPILVSLKGSYENEVLFCCHINYWFEFKIDRSRLWII